MASFDGYEECDDGSIDDGDGCSSSCQIETCFECTGMPSVCTLLAQGTPCGAAGGCVAAQCDGNGSCASVLDVRTCRGAERSKLLIVDGDDDSDKLVWKWTRGTSTSQTEFADPLSTTTYELCLFAGTAAVLAAAQVGSDAQSWSALDNTGYLYDDAGGSQDGIRKILLKGHDAGRAKIVLKGKGADLPDLHPPLTLPITVQLLNTDTDVCCSSTFTAADPNRPGKFKAKVP